MRLEGGAWWGRGQRRGLGGTSGREMSPGRDLRLRLCNEGAGPPEGRGLKFWG